MLAATVMPVVMITSAALCLLCGARSRNPLQLVAACVMFAAMLDHAVTGLVPPVLWAALLMGAGLGVGLSLRLSDGRATSRGGAGVSGAAPAALGEPCHGHGILTALSYPAMGALLLVSAAPPAQTSATSLVVEELHQHGGVPSPGLLTVAVVVLALGLACVALAAVRGGQRLAATDAGAMSLMLGTMLA
ncbi:hypothetical protein FB468_3065 [Leucobacter komagatae]|uniref:Uncharacterized protein n=1 Tax=Leucobacter komagatae TaxID=55969 RepID=A0A542XXI7_9MICO|nr:hypothetical protein [Leucobacter komagatae]TQL40544.1 hypothetical protein FB468_3065 [Leucobacter komagatae]